MATIPFAFRGLGIGEDRDTHANGREQSAHAAMHVEVWIPSFEGEHGGDDESGYLLHAVLSRGEPTYYRATDIASMIYEGNLRGCIGQQDDGIDERP
jgi:hypothetical protein